MSDAPFTISIGPEFAGSRLDQAVAQLCPDWSRARLQRWIKSGAITVDGERWRPRDRLKGGEDVRIVAEHTDEVDAFVPEPVDLQVVHEDAHLLVLDKPPGLVVHPAPGHWGGTILNGLLSRYPELRGVPRAGIVHRLDKDTSGLMVVARTLEAHHRLVDALQRRAFGREYIALVSGQVVAGGRIEAPIGRHRQDRKRMTVTESGKHAVTHYRLRHRYRAHSLLDVKLETGRTHQIRVHLAHIRYPIVGDPVYGGRPRLAKGMAAQAVEVLARFRRQALHAGRLTLDHPISGETLTWERPPPADFITLLEALENDAP